jgi:hypothetical protein
MFLAVGMLLQPSHVIHFDDVPYVHQHLVCNLPYAVAEPTQLDDSTSLSAGVVGGGDGSDGRGSGSPGGEVARDSEAPVASGAAARATSVRAEPTGEPAGATIHTPGSALGPTPSTITSAPTTPAPKMPEMDLREKSSAPKMPKMDLREKSSAPKMSAPSMSTPATASGRGRPPVQLEADLEVFTFTADLEVSSPGPPAELARASAHDALGGVPTVGQQQGVQATGGLARSSQVRGGTQGAEAILFFTEAAQVALAAEFLSQWR